MDLTLLPVLLNFGCKMYNGISVHLLKIWKSDGCNIPLIRKHQYLKKHLVAFWYHGDDIPLFPFFLLREKKCFMLWIFPSHSDLCSKKKKKKETQSLRAASKVPANLWVSLVLQIWLPVGLFVSFRENHHAMSSSSSKDNIWCWKRKKRVTEKVKKRQK